jgi:predicted component of type VI protein secretion system
LNIAIQIISISERPLHGPGAVFGPGGGTIGRRSDNTLVIPDATRHVSRLHAAVFWSQGAFRIRDQGSFLPVYVNGRGIGFQRDMTLRAGDRIQIGPYVLLVSEADPSRAVTGTAGNGGQRPMAPIEVSAAHVERVPTFEEIQARLAAAKAAGHHLTRGSGHASQPQADADADAATTQSLHAGQSPGHAVADTEADRLCVPDTVDDQRQLQAPSGRPAVGLTEAARALLRWRS